MVQLVHGCRLLPGQVSYEGPYVEAFDGSLYGNLLRYARCLCLGLHEPLKVVPQCLSLTLSALKQVRAG